MTAPDHVRIMVRELPGPLAPGVPQKFEASTEAGEVLVRRTRHPFYAGARALLKHGLDPDTLVTMRWRSSGSDSVAPVPVRVAAGLTTEEGDNPIRIRRWHDPAKTGLRAGGIGRPAPSRAKTGWDGPETPTAFSGAPVPEQEFSA